MGLKDKEIRLHGVKHNGNGETVIKPWQDMKTRVMTIGAIFTVAILVGGVAAQVKAIVDTVAKVDSLQLEIDVNYAVQDSMKERLYDKNKAQMKLFTAIARAVMPKSDADTLINDVEKEMEQDKKHADEQLEKEIKRIKERVKKK